MKVEAASIEELIEHSGAHAGSMAQLDELIVEVAPQLKRQLFSGPSITMIGYGELVWTNMSSSGIWPVIAVAPQKHLISMYVAAERDGVPLVQLYDDRLGKTNNGKNCVRFRKFDGLNKSALIDLIREAVIASEEQERIYGRNCAVPVESNA